MAKPKVSQKEFDETLKAVEANHCFRFQAGCDDSSAFMVPVSRDGETVIGPSQRFTWKQLKALAQIKRPPSLM